MSLELKLALEGNLETELAKERRRIAAALLVGVTEAAEAVQGKLRRDFAGSGLARAEQLQKTWRLKRYPNAERDPLEPAALVYSTWARVIAAFESGATIKGKDGGFLLVPNPDVWPGGRVKGARQAGRTDALAIAERRFGPLRFVYRKRGASLLVAEARQTKAGAFGRATAAQSRRAAAGQASGLTTIVVFFLVKQTRLPRLLRGADIRRQAERDAPQDVQRGFERAMAASAAGPITPRPPSTE